MSMAKKKGSGLRVMLIGLAGVLLALWSYYDVFLLGRHLNPGEWTATIGATILGPYIVYKGYEYRKQISG